MRYARGLLALGLLALVFALPVAAEAPPVFVLKIPNQPSLNTPFGVAAAPSGHIWVADTGHSQLVRLDPTNPGAELRVGSYGSGDGQFNFPVGVAVDGAGNVYVSDSDNNRIQKFDSSGAFLLKWGS